MMLPGEEEAGVGRGRWGDWEELGRPGRESEQEAGGCGGTCAPSGED